MTAVHVDTLKLATRLEAGGFTMEQARALASALGDAAEVADLVTNTDLTTALAATRNDLTTALAATRAELKVDIALLEHRMTIRLGGMLVVMTGVIGALFRYLH